MNITFCKHNDISLKMNGSAVELNVDVLSVS